MIILDTNVVSEPLKPRANQIVQDWLDQQAVETLYLTSTSLSELLYGIALLPAGKRKRVLSAGLEELVDRLFPSRVLPFDAAAAAYYASLASSARAKGHDVSVADAQIAAIAKVHGFVVATRDLDPFRVMNIPVVNPWAEQKP